MVVWLQRSQMLPTLQPANYMRLHIFSSLLDLSRSSPTPTKLDDCGRPDYLPTASQTSRNRRDAAIKREDKGTKYPLSHFGHTSRYPQVVEGGPKAFRGRVGGTTSMHFILNT